jgi:dethiobiotin synthetase
MRVFITGTGTGVGKTWVGRALAEVLRDAGKRVTAIKPVETGCTGSPGDREDGVLLAQAARQKQPLHAILRLPTPGDPILGGEGVDTAIDFDGLVLKIERYAEDAEFLLMEGAGGLLTPVTWEWNMADVARALGACALVVGVDRLGTINHTLLTLSALELAGIPCVGVVLTVPEVKDGSTGLNAAAIARLSGIERVLSLPRTSDPRHVSVPMTTVTGWLSRVAAPA